MNLFAQQDARGAFAFTGAATQETAGGVPVAGTGSDLADFLIGTPDTAQISFGNPDKYLRGWGFDAFINDDWRVNSGITLNIGLRWEFAEPFTEEHDRLSNLDLAPNFSVATPVTAGAPTGTVTGQNYPNALVRPDYRGIEPRIGIAWRPRLSSPLVIRAGYGVYDNTSVYQVVATQLSEQPPFTKTLSVQNSAATPLTLGGAFNTTPTGTINTFAVDPNFRIGYAQNWQVSVQEDLPASLVLTATYNGIKGTRLMQESLPNTYPVGATNPCPGCPLGFVISVRMATPGARRARSSCDGGSGTALRQTSSTRFRNRLTMRRPLAAQGLRTGTGNTTTTPLAAAAANANVSTPNSNSPAVAQNWQNLRGELGSPPASISAID